MNEISVALYFHDALGRRQLAHARLVDGQTWRVFSDLGGRNFSRECGSWQGVERTLIWLRRHAHEPGRTTVGPLAAVWVALAVLLGATGAAAQPLMMSDAERQFVAATRDYASMHRRIENIVGPAEINADMARIDRAVRVLAAAIRVERPHAAVGDLFTPALAFELRARIFGALAALELTADDIREAEVAGGVDPHGVMLQINGAFPWALGTAMFPCVIAALPPLPAELQYRIVGDTLVLIDVHASLIVDLLPAVLSPSTERWR